MCMLPNVNGNPMQFFNLIVGVTGVMIIVASLLITQFGAGKPHKRMKIIETTLCPNGRARFSRRS